jgi:hypothetical protein
MYWGASKTGGVLQILHRQESAWLKLAINDQIFDSLVRKIAEVNAVAPALCGPKPIIIDKRSTFDRYPSIFGCALSFGTGDALPVRHG